MNLHGEKRRAWKKEGKNRRARQREPGREQREWMTRSGICIAVSIQTFNHFLLRGKKYTGKGILQGDARPAYQLPRGMAWGSPPISLCIPRPPKRAAALGRGQENPNMHGRERGRDLTRDAFFKKQHTPCPAAPSAGTQDGESIGKPVALRKDPPSLHFTAQDEMHRKRTMLKSCSLYFNRTGMH